MLLPWHSRHEDGEVDVGTVHMLRKCSSQRSQTQESFRIEEEPLLAQMTVVYVLVPVYGEYTVSFLTVSYVTDFDSGRVYG